MIWPDLEDVISVSRLPNPSFIADVGTRNERFFSFFSGRQIYSFFRKKVFWPDLEDVISVSRLPNPFFIVDVGTRDERFFGFSQADRTTRSSKKKRFGQIWKT